VRVVRFVLLVVAFMPVSVIMEKNTT